MHTHAAARGARGGGRVDHGHAEGAGRWASGLRSPAPLWAFVNRDREPRHQHDMRAFVMAARSHAKTGKLSEVMCYNGVTESMLDVPYQVLRYSTNNSLMY